MSNLAAIQLSWELRRDQGALSRQLSDQIRLSIKSGALRAGDRIPASRSLAQELGVARGTVASAIELLIAEGVLEARTGAGTYVAAEAAYMGLTHLSDLKPQIRFQQLPPAPDIDPPCSGAVDFRPCRPSLEIFPMGVWRRCVAAAASALPDSDYGDPRGMLGLREAIASYLRRARGLTLHADQVIITNGSVQAMHILALLYLGPKTTAAFEDPGFPLARQTFAMTGAALYFCPVDEHGLITDALSSAPKNTRLVYVTPSHQFPTGGRLSLRRRRELVEWANEKGALILEDDYDGEYRYDVPPLAPLAAFAPHTVIYCGTFSKTLFPGLRMGFAVAPASIIDAMARHRTVSEYAPNEVIQRALKKFIEEGEFERHILRMRRLYTQKRSLVSRLLKPMGRKARLTGLESGLSALIELSDHHDADKVAIDLADEGILMPSLSRYCAQPKRSVNALVCGYAEPKLDDIRACMTHLKKVLSER